MPDLSILNLWTPEPPTLDMPTLIRLGASNHPVTRRPRRPPRRDRRETGLHAAAARVRPASSMVVPASRPVSASTIA